MQPTIDREQLVKANMNLARCIAMRISPGFRLSATERDDAIADAYLGLVSAARAFDPSRGVPFGAFASRWISGAVLRGIDRRDPVSHRARETLREAQDAINNLSIENGRSLSPREVRAAAPRFDRARRQVFEQSAASLDAQTSVGTWIQVPGNTDVEATVLGEIDQDAVRAAVAELDPRSQHVILAMFCDDETAASLSQAMHVTPQRVLQIRARALGDLRAALTGANTTTKRRGPRRASA